jgi:hypothetical protein
VLYRGALKMSNCRLIPFRHSLRISSIYFELSIRDTLVNDLNVSLRM